MLLCVGSPLALLNTLEENALSCRGDCISGAAGPWGCSVAVATTGERGRPCPAHGDGQTASI